MVEAATATANPFAAGADAMMREWQTMLRKTLALPKVVEAAQRVRVGTTPTRIVYSEDKLRLLQYRTEDEQTVRTPLVVVFALINRPYILDLKPDRSVVRQFLRAGFDVYNVDWGIPTSGDRFLSIEDYVERYLDHVVDEVRRRCDVDSINVLGYCMGGSLSAMYTALHPEKVRNLMMLAAPVDWSDRESLLSVWTDPKYFDVDKMIDVFGNAPAEWLQSSFALLKPVQNLIGKYVNFYEKMDDEKFLEDFFAMETWLNDNIPVAGETFRQFVKDLFQKNLLMKGEMEIGGRRVDLKRITCPILNLMASNDHLVPCGQSAAFNDAVGSSDRRAITLPAGHIGMAVGSKAHRDLWPAVCEWLKERSEGKGRRGKDETSKRRKAK